jgi:hypothetical protein
MSEAGQSGRSLENPAIVLTARLEDRADQVAAIVHLRCVLLAAVA